MSSKNTKHYLKTQNQPKNKNIPMLGSLILGTFKVKKTNLNSPYHIKVFDTKSIILVVEIIINNNFLSLR